MKQTHSTTKLLAAAIFELIIAIDLLFPTWLGMDVYLASGSASLWRVGKLMSTLANYAGSDSNFLYTLISIIIYILLVLSLVAVVLTGRSLYQAYKKKDTPVKMAGFVIPAVLSVLVILVVVIGNAIVSSESDGWITSVFFLKGAPIINLILAVLDEGLTPAEKLAAVQQRAERGEEPTLTVFRDIGVYLGHTLPLYAAVYDLQNLLVLGRVASGVGGEQIVSACRRVLAEEYPSLEISVTLPDERFRRVGQSMAAASLPEVE